VQRQSVFTKDEVEAN